MISRMRQLAAAVLIVPLISIADSRAADLGDVRPIQIDYPSPGAIEANAIVLWTLDGEFEEIRVTVDGGPPRRVLDGKETSARLGLLILGPHRVEVQGVAAGEVTATAQGGLIMLPEPPVPGVESDGCLFYAHDPVDGGFLDVFWTNRDTPLMPYQDYDILVNGVFQKVLDAPAEALQFTGVPPGTYTVEVVAYTRNHICPATAIRCRAEPVAPVSDPWAELVRCEDLEADFLVRYTLPAEHPLDGVAAYLVAQSGAGFLLGLFPPGDPVPVEGLRQGDERTVELVSFRGDSASTIPGVPGPHVQTSLVYPGAGCPARPRFRRGDADAGGSLDLTDPVTLLNWLFIGGPRPACVDAADVDDDGQVDISDAISNLAYQFLGGPAPADPGPTDCGPDAGREEPDLGCDRPCA